jgi:C1A family cysteine protease
MLRLPFFKSRIGFLLVVVLLMACPAVLAADDPNMAPLNPEFLAWQQAQDSNAIKAFDLTGNQVKPGYRPSPIDLSHIQGSVFFNAQKGLAAPISFPATYDLRALGQVTAIRDIGYFRTCWAHAALASLESSLLKAGRGTYDLSEWHLAWYAYNDFDSEFVSFTRQWGVPAGYDTTFDEGAHNWIAVAILARGTGAVNESDCPYQHMKHYPSSALPKGNEPVSVKLQQALYLGRLGENGDTHHHWFNATSMDIKTAVMNYGAVNVAIIWHPLDLYYNERTHTYRCTTMGADHDVDIVGWNDARQVWIARNNVGTSWGASGYFYITYDSAMVELAAYLSGMTPYSRTYQYDPLGWCNSWGYSDPTAWFSNVFTAQEDEKITAVSFYTAAIDSAYEISIYKDVTADPATGTLAFGPQTGTPDAPGYRMVELSSPVTVSSGQKFAVIVKLTTPGYNFPVPIETPISRYSDKARAHPGESYCSHDGTTWTDMTAVKANTNVCLKAFATSASDLNMDGEADVADMAVLAAQYNTSGPDADLNSDGVVDDLDITILLQDI